jgi:hypothetical protein
MPKPESALTARKLSKYNNGLHDSYLVTHRQIQPTSLKSNHWRQRSGGETAKRKEIIAFRASDAGGMRGRHAHDRVNRP